MTELESMKYFGENLEYCMKESGIDQRELAKETGISQATLSRYLAGKQMPSMRSISNIAHVLHYEPNDLIDFYDELIE